MRKTSFPILLILGVVVLGTIILLFQNPAPQADRTLSYTQFLALEDRLRSATINGDRVIGHDEAGRLFTTQVPSGSAVATRLAERGVEVTIAPAAETRSTDLFVSILYYVYILILLWYLDRIARALERSKPDSP